jgi:hypothetical protein
MSGSNSSRPTKIVPTTLVGLVCLIAWNTAFAKDIVFAPRDIAGWEAKKFKGAVQYNVTQIDGREAVHAMCSGKDASALFLRREIDLAETPILEWSWRIEDTFGVIDETTKSGDDYPVRVYAVVDGGLLQWRTEAVNYVWASNRPKGSAWPNAYASQAMMTALQSGASRAGEWVTERVDLAKDFRSLHGSSHGIVHGLAIMTDCDDIGKPIEGWYGEIRLRAR